MTYNTEQRTILLSFLQNNPDKMFSAKQIEIALADKNISRSAVYRNLSELEAEKKIKRSTKKDSRDTFYQYYDIQTCKNHIHLLCNTCGKIFHMENDLANNLITNVQTSLGFEINKGDTTLYGICKNCGDKNE